MMKKQYILIDQLSTLKIEMKTSEYSIDIILQQIDACNNYYFDQFKSFAKENYDFETSEINK